MVAVQNLLYDIQKFPWATSEVFRTIWCGFVHFWFLQYSLVWNAVTALCSRKTSMTLRSNQAQYFIISLFVFAWNYLDVFLHNSALHFAILWPILLQLYYTGMGFHTCSWSVTVPKDFEWAGLTLLKWSLIRVVLWVLHGQLFFPYVVMIIPKAS